MTVDFFFPLFEACIFVENVVSIYPFSCVDVNLSYQDELIKGLLHNTIFPEGSETRQHVSAARQLLLTNTGLKSKPQGSSIDVECVSLKQLCGSKSYLKYFVATLQDGSYRTEHHNHLLKERLCYLLLS